VTPDAGGVGDATAAAPAPGTESVWDLIVKGGPTLAVIGLASLVALTIVIERVIVTRRRAVIPAGFEKQLKAAGGDRTRELDICKRNASPMANILKTAILRRGDSPEAVRVAVADVGGRELVRLRHRMRLLGAMPQIATMLGLLGTIFGMIKTFQVVAASGQSLGKTELLAGGIFEAWTNTAAGLIVAIPVLIAYHMLMGRIDATAAEMDRVASDFIEDDRVRGVERGKVVVQIQQNHDAVNGVTDGVKKVTVAEEG
jgi:biopolymer transport protein ExbB